MAGSLLRSAGLEELVTFDLAGYEGVAVEMASGGGSLRRLRDRLRDEKESGRLFATERLVTEFEMALSTTLLQS
jgi:predicted O-linked N-acetylglucosamine transferase (SPINDLY family)